MYNHVTFTITTTLFQCNILRPVQSVQAAADVSDAIHCSYRLCLPNDYDCLVPPNNVLSVYVRLYDGAVKQVDDGETTLTIDTQLDLVWQDERINLSDEAAYNYEKLHPTVANSVWTPTVEFKNRIRKQDDKSPLVYSLGE